jgi:DNA (cytosine-5)-methyltransferase 1
MVYRFSEEEISTSSTNVSDLIKKNYNKNSGMVEVPYKKRGYKVNIDKEKIIDSTSQAIGLFSGAGGLDVGTQLAGVKMISSMDFDPDSVKTMKKNNFFSHTDHLLEDIKNLDSKYYDKILKQNKPDKLIMVGGPPCQPFSKAGYWVTHKNRLGNDDPRNMIGQYLKMISDIQPDGFLLENVESILHPKNAPAVDQLKETIDKMGYHFIVYKANSADFGVPQKRKRVFFLASKKEIKGTPIKTHGTDKEILNDHSLLPYERVVDWIAKYDHDKYFEKEEVTTGKTYSFELSEVPPGKNYIALTSKAGYPDPKFIANKRFWSFLLKLHPELPSWTIAAQPGPWVGPFHWKSRRLRVPEIAALQTFPEDYLFHGSRRSIQKQIGNAVPSLLGKSMVEFLMKNI